MTFGEVQPLSPEGRIITVLIIVGGLIFVQFTFQKTVRLFESGYFQRVNELRFKRILRKMENHVILCGYGRVGQEISNQIKTQNIPIIVVESDEERKKIAEIMFERFKVPSLYFANRAVFNSWSVIGVTYAAVYSAIFADASLWQKIRVINF